MAQYLDSGIIILRNVFYQNEMLTKNLKIFLRKYLLSLLESISIITYTNVETHLFSSLLDFCYIFWSHVHVRVRVLYTLLLGIYLGIHTSKYYIPYSIRYTVYRYRIQYGILY